MYVTRNSFLLIIVHYIRTYTYTHIYTYMHIHIFTYTYTYMKKIDICLGFWYLGTAVSES